jgi:hypothetical protein
LHGQTFIITTDHKSLLHLTDQKVVSRLQQKALIKLMDSQYQIQYKKGISNVAADSLSRTPDALNVFSISHRTPTWLEKLQQGYEDDEEAKLLLTQLAVSRRMTKDFL